MEPTVAPVVELAPRDAQLAYGRAVYAEAVQDREEAARQWAWVRRLDGSNPWAWMAAARGARAGGEPAVAMGYLDQAEALAPGLDELAWERALTRAALGEDADEALCAAAAELDGRWPEAMEVATDEQEVFAAWSQVEIGGHEAESRATWGASLERWSEAHDDMERAMAWVATPERLVRWVEVAEQSCRLDPVRAWVAEHRPQDWGIPWSAAVQRQAVAQCAEVSGTATGDTRVEIREPKSGAEPLDR